MDINRSLQKRYRYHLNQTRFSPSNMKSIVKSVFDLLPPVGCLICSFMYGQPNLLIFGFMCGHYKLLLFGIM